MAHYSFYEVHIVEQKFRKYFGVSFQKFYDGILSIVCKHLMIDILKFDDWLHSQFGNYEDEGKSMRDIIHEKYGDNAVELIKNLID